jgi:hypothetical protein
MARKQKNDEKMKRRQGKTETAPAEERPEVAEDVSLNETDPAGISIPQDS